MIADPVADVVQCIEDAGLPYEVNGVCTVVEAEWDEVMPILKHAEAQLRRNCDRVFLLITVDDHGARMGRLRGAIADVEERLVHTLPLS
jgi:uncharacterized protein YqgV (UPF0045/DUF77 family)